MPTPPPPGHPPLQFTHPIQAVDRLHNGATPPRRKPFSERGITAVRLATYNLQDGRNSRLAFAIRAIEVSKINLAVLTETRFHNDIYTKSYLGYEVVGTTTTHQNQGGVALVFQEEPDGWSVESIRKHGPNVISCELVIGDTRTPLIGAYLPPGDLLTLPFVTEAIDRFPGKTPILMGDLNANIHAENRPRDSEIADFCSFHGLEDMLVQF